MIGFSHCSYSHELEGDRHVVLDQADLVVRRSDRVCVLARSGAGKSTVLSLLRGALQPVEGHVMTDEALSWPVGAAGAFHPALTGEENVRTLAMMLGVDPDWTSTYTLVFSELGEDFYRPMKTYSAGKRAQLSYSFSYAVPRPMYLAEDGVGAGSEEFVLRCEAAMSQRLEKSGLFLITRSLRIGELFGERFFILEGGRFIQCEDFAEAKARFEQVETQPSGLHELLMGFDSIE